MSSERKVIVVIPSYEPDDKLIQLLKEIKGRTAFSILVVDDGSGINYRQLFEGARKYAEVITYEKNQGKGHTLKTAFAYIEKNWQEEAVSIVTADSDGQHKVSDIIKTVHMLQENPNALVLGSRTFTGRVPLRSKMGNRLTSKVFQLSAGVKVGDTQTGLRAFNGEYLEKMQDIQGERYEYEMNVLMQWAKEDRSIDECPIETVYINENESSHFHPVRDSIQIYKELIKFSLSSLVSFALDYFLYVALIVATQGLSVNLSLGISNITSRIVSATVNYSLNRQLVFKSNENVIRTAMQYAALSIIILLLNTVCLSLLVNTLITNQFVAKIVVECLLFFVSIYVQKHIIFKKKSHYC